MGALVERVLGEAQHDNLLLDLHPYLGVHGVLPVLPLLLLGLGFGLDLWGSSGDVFCPGPSAAVGLTIIVSDTSAVCLQSIWCFVRSLAVIKVAVFLEV